MRRFGDKWATGAEPWLAGTGDHISISCRRSPEVSGPKGRLAGKSRGKLLSPFASPQLSRSHQSIHRAGSRPGPSAAWRRLTFPFPRKGLPQELREVLRGPVTLIRDVKGDFGNLLLPPAPATTLFLRRGQVEKSPVGREGHGNFQGRPCPEILDDGNLRRSAFCALKSRGSAAAREPAHLWSRRGLALTSSGLDPAPSPFGTDRTESELGWRLG